MTDDELIEALQDWRDKYLGEHDPGDAEFGELLREVRAASSPLAVDPFEQDLAEVLRPATDDELAAARSRLIADGILIIPASQELADDVKRLIQDQGGWVPEPWQGDDPGPEVTVPLATGGVVHGPPEQLVGEYDPPPPVILAVAHARLIADQLTAEVRASQANDLKMLETTPPWPTVQGVRDSDRRPRQALFWNSKRCWNAMRPIDQEHLRVTDQFVGYHADDDGCDRDAEVAIELKMDEAPGPRSYCWPCAQAYLDENRP